jgi:hypothetical protein
MVIGILQDRLKELETNMVQHETKRNELISDGDKEEKKLNRDFEKRGKAISLLALGKAVDARGETVKRIANNEAMPMTTKKAGFVDVSFSSNQQKENEELRSPFFKENEEALINDIKYSNLGEDMDLKESFIINLSELLDKYTNQGFIEKIEGKIYRTNKPFNESVSNQTVKPNSYNQSVNRTVKPNEQNKQEKEPKEATVNQTVITERLTDKLDSSLFTNEELKLITILWDNGNVKTNDSLVTRKEVLTIIGDTKVNTTLLRDLYKKLLQLKYIYKRVGYFAKVEV